MCCTAGLLLPSQDLGVQPALQPIHRLVARELRFSYHAKQLELAKPVRYVGHRASPPQRRDEAGEATLAMSRTALC